MNKEKQIEEMAKVLSTVKRCDAFTVSECIKRKCQYPHYEGVTCIAEHQAEKLYNAGYRKASEVAREIFEEIDKMLDTVTIVMGRLDSLRTFHKTIEKVTSTVDELKKKYTKEITEEVE